MRILFWRKKAGTVDPEQALVMFTADDDLGLPLGLEPPPPQQDIDWMSEIPEMARLGVPRPGHPARCTDAEGAAELMFAADMHEVTKWGRRQKTLIPGLLEIAGTERSTLDATLRKFEREITVTEDDLDAQRDQMSDQDMKFPGLARQGSTLAAAGTVGFGTLEIITLKPMIGTVIGTDDFTAGAMSGLIVTGICSAMWGLGRALHRGLTYEGPARIRRLYLAVAAGLGLVVGVGALVAIVGIRVAGGDDGMGTESHVLGGLLYGSVQAAVQFLAAAHGWSVGNPRVRQLKVTERHLKGLQTGRDSLEARLGDVETWVESLAEFDISDWMTSHRARIAADYGAANRDFRHQLGLALLDEGHDESADTLHLLPLPQFVPPVEVDDDDPGGWLTGWIQPL